MRTRLLMSLLSLFNLASCSTAYRSLSAEKFSELVQGNVQILDARTAWEYAKDTIC